MKVSHQFKEIKKQFQGIAGFRYHPTKGFKKDNGFRPLSAKEIADALARKNGIA
jgi:hypothetical protein